MRALRRIADDGPLLLPGALTVYFAFNAGGFFVGTQGAVAAALAAILLARALLVPDPMAGAGRALAVVAGTLGSFATWTLL